MLLGPKALEEALQMLPDAVADCHGQARDLRVCRRVVRKFSSKCKGGMQLRSQPLQLLCSMLAKDDADPASDGLDCADGASSLQADSASSSGQQKAQSLQPWPKPHNDDLKDMVTI